MGQSSTKGPSDGDQELRVKVVLKSKDKKELLEKTTDYPEDAAGFVNLAAYLAHTEHKNDEATKNFEQAIQVDKHNAYCYGTFTILAFI